MNDYKREEGLLRWVKLAAPVVKEYTIQGERHMRKEGVASIYVGAWR
jgi:hypothetical protein